MQKRIDAWWDLSRWDDGFGLADPVRPTAPERPWLSKMQGHIDEWWKIGEDERASRLAAINDMVDAFVFGMGRHPRTSAWSSGLIKPFPGGLT